MLHDTRLIKPIGYHQFTHFYPLSGPEPVRNPPVVLPGDVELRLAVDVDPHLTPLRWLLHLAHRDHEPAMLRRIREFEGATLGDGVVHRHLLHELRVARSEVGDSHFRPNPPV